MPSLISTIAERGEAPEHIVRKQDVVATLAGGEFQLPSLEGRIRKELAGKLDELFKGVDGHPNQMIILTGLVYELIALLDAKGVVSIDDLTVRFATALTGDPAGFNVLHTMGQRSFRGLGTDQL
jgi:hypothetical protein